MCKHFTTYASDGTDKLRQQSVSHCFETYFQFFAQQNTFITHSINDTLETKWVNNETFRQTHQLKLLKTDFLQEAEHISSSKFASNIK